jgi:small subunit ribosomal protein S17
VGVVTSDKGDKTIRVACDFSVKHPKYGKYIRRRVIVLAHDEQNAAKTGDRVEVMTCRPLSKTKSWRLVRVLGHL